MTPAEYRRLCAAAWAVDALPARVDRLQARYDAAETKLRAALTDAAQVSLPGFTVTLGHDRLNVARSDTPDAAQLALWRALQAEA
jgi:hypothetical protein